MELNDIIRRDSDRIFMVDPECFIIFTGSTLDDQQPFIRIGNWFDMPAGLIPLIENIIIPDRMIGNPAYEQFSIDVDYLPTNRYIGSQGLVKRFLNFQKVFGLDLRNATVVDADSEIPEMNGRKLTRREGFTGIFYSDGNFRIKHGSSDLFDLSTALSASMCDIASHERLTRITRKPEGAGVIITDGNPVFFSKTSLVSYLFPANYYERFARLGINPRYITAVLHPSDNLLNITRFLKWKNYSRSRLELIAQHTGDIANVKALFTDAQISITPFEGFARQWSDMEIGTIPGSYNVAVQYGEQKCRMVFIKSSGGLKSALATRPDLALVAYTAYEDTAAAFRSGTAPFAVIDDGHPGFARVACSATPALYQEAQYRILQSRPDELRGIVTARLGAAGINFSDDEEFTDAASALLGGDADWTARFNVAAALRFLETTSSSRKVVSRCRDLIRDYQLQHGAALRTLAHGNLFSLHCVDGACIILHESLIAQEVRLQPEHLLADPKPLLDTPEAEMAQKIFRDRERLAALTELFSRSPSRSEHIKRLSDAIALRKLRFSVESFPDLAEKKKTVLSVVKDLVGVSGNGRDHFPGSELHQEFTEDDFSKAARLRELCRAIKADGYDAAGFKLPEGPEGLDWLNSIVRSTGFPAAWKAVKGRAGIRLKRSTAAMLKNAGSLTGRDFDSLSGEEKGKIALLNRSLIAETYLAADDARTQEPAPRSLVRRHARKILIAGLIAVVTAVLIFSLLPQRTSSPQGKSGAAKPVRTGLKPPISREQVESELVRVLPPRPRLAGWDYEVFVMANRIAITNGYSPILELEFGKRNPNWIFPGNVFVLPSGEAVTVQSGDTLWAIADRFLRIAHQNFEKAFIGLGEARRKGRSLDKAAIAEARNWAYTMQDRRLLDEITSGR